MNEPIKRGAAALLRDRRFLHFACRVVAHNPATNTYDVRLADEADKGLVPSEYDTSKRVVKVSHSCLILI